MSVLGKAELEELIAQTDYSKKLVITPLLSESQIGPTSIDIRLGSSIVIPRRTFVSSHDVTNPEQARQVEKRLYDRCQLKYHTEFVLHPNQLILAVTLLFRQLNMYQTMLWHSAPFRDQRNEQLYRFSTEVVSYMISNQT